MEKYKKFYPNEIKYCDNIEETLKDADICFIFTEWSEIKNFNISLFSKLMKNPLVIDGRNCYDLEKVKTAGIIYESIGRSTNNGLISSNDNATYDDEAAASISK